MNVFFRITARSLQKNKTRTVVTIIGVILSAALITGVAVTISSLQDYLIKGTIAETGHWHVAMETRGFEIAELCAEPEVEFAGILQQLGDTVVERPDSQGSSADHELPKGVLAVSDEVFREVPLLLTEGRLPRNEKELVVPQWMNDTFCMGETYTILIGDVAVPIPVDPNNPELGSTGWAIKDPTAIKRYTIVGYYVGFFLGNNELFLTWMNNLEDASLEQSENYILVLQLKNPSHTYSFMDKHSDFASSPNAPLLRAYGLFARDSVMRAFYAMAIILIAIVVVGSVSLIHNAFAISVSERSRQFGILSSVGATKKQLASSVLYEGLLVAIIGIPLGILCGIVGIGITLGAVGKTLASRLIAEGAPLTLSVPIPVIALAAAIALFTIMISAYIPAARAAKISAIDAIRQTKDIALRAKTVRGGWLAGKLFGLEGSLATKSFKRNRKRYRSTVFSLFISVVVFLSAASFALYLKEGQQGAVEIPKYNIFYVSSLNLSETDTSVVQLFDEMRGEEHISDGLWVSFTSSYVKSPQLLYSERRMKYERERYSEAVPSDLGSISIAFMQDEAFGRYLDQLGLPRTEFMGIGAERVIAFSTSRDAFGRDGRIERFDSFIDTNRPLAVTLLDWHEVFDEQIVGYGREYPLVITDFATQSPDFISLGSFSTPLDIILPTSRGSELAYCYEGCSPYFFFSSDDPYATCDNYIKILAGLGQSGATGNARLVNVDAQNRSNQDTIFVINVFAYGFIIIISLIAVANVFNTISTSIRLRRRELAMLKSIGMSDNSFKRMMNFECALFGLKSLLYGLSVAALMTYLMYRVMNNAIEMPFILPLPEIFIAIVAVFSVIYASMLYSTRRIKKENIIEALRDEIA